MINKFIGVGQISNQIMTRDTKTGKSVSKCRLVCGRASIAVEAWDEISDLLRSFKLGDYISVEGEIKNNNYLSRDGKKIFETVVSLSHVEAHKDVDLTGVKTYTPQEVIAKAEEFRKVDGGQEEMFNQPLSPAHTPMPKSFSERFSTGKLPVMTDEDVPF